MPHLFMEQYHIVSIGSEERYGRKIGFKKRIYSLDALKAVAAFMVCYQHACGTGYFSEYILLLCKVAVPVFILITGFMYRDTVQYGNVKKQIVKFL